ncbi:MAG: 4-hydroxy-tetrahydrodipicolinate reductase [Calditrichia bacterium]
MISVAVNGAGGRMGRAILQELRDSKVFQAACGFDPSGGELAGVPVLPPGSEIPAEVQAVIDFSLPGGAIEILNQCRKQQIPLVSGTTGLDESQMADFQKAAEDIPVVQAFNFSIGINLLLKLTETAAGILKNSDVEIVETHHRNKKDAPSGTALLLAEKVAQALGKSREELLQYGRRGKELSRGSEIGLHSLRGGSVIGEHQVHFLGENENLLLQHSALNRTIFVEGALQAVRWVIDQKPGLYGMPRVLGF